MKKIITLLFGIWIGLSAYGQFTWSSSIPMNPDVDSPYSAMESIVYDNDVYQVWDSAGTYMELARYNSESGIWKSITMIYNADGNYNFHTQVVNGEWFIASQGTTITTYKYNFVNDQFSFCPGTITLAFNDNWEMLASPANNKIYIFGVENDVNTFIAEFNTTTGNFNSINNVTSFLNSSSMDLSAAKLELYLSSTDVYMGVSGVINKLVHAPFNNISAPSNYNISGSNNGLIFLNGTALVNGFFYLTGDGQSDPVVTVQDAVNYEAFEVQTTGVDINPNTGTDTPLSFYTSSLDHQALSETSYSFLVSPFSTVNNGGNPDKFYVYRKDLGSGTWDSIGGKIEPGVVGIGMSSLRLSLNNNPQTHMAVTFKDAAGQVKFRVLNNKPSIIPASESVSSGMCGGHNNLIYPQLEIEDADNDHIRIVSVTSTNGYVQNCYAVPIGVDNTSSPGISKFAVYGFVNTQGNTSIIVTYTDGYNIFTDTLTSITISGTAPNIVFTPSTLMLCSNENMINLNDYVNYVDQGIFNINGYPVENGVFDATELSQVMTGGSVNYTINVDGCIVQTGTSFAFVTPGIASATATPATCGNTDGTATVVFTQGSSPNYTVEWSTGETASTILNLTPGAYYYNVTDEYGCHSTGFANVETISIDVVETITPISCYGANDGAISVAVSGPANYTTLWSNGYSNAFIDNLGPGNYWVTVVDESNNCTVTYDYQLTEPAEITASFSAYEPDCSAQNGNIYGVYNGGNGGYTFEWLAFGQTTADLYNVGFGIYEVEVTDNLGCKDTFEYVLNDYQAIDIVETIYPASCNINNGAIMVSLMQDPLGGPTFANSVEWSNGVTTVSNGSIGSGEYTIYVESGPSPVNSNTCHSMKKMFVPIKAPIRQEICLVTVDTATTTNLVVWAKSETYGIDHYNIYRENTVAGEFSLIDTVDFNSLSVFNDVVASPMDRSWRYRISQVNDCGVESPVSVEHKTLHLNTIDVIPNQSVNIFWDDYEGPIGAAEYVVWRNTDQNGWEALTPTVPIGTTTFTDGTITGLTGLDYYIEMVLGVPCTAEKAQDFNTTRSNKDKGAFSSGNGTGNSNNSLGEETIDFSIYPNPTDDELTISISENGLNKRIILSSISGQIIESFNITELNQTVSLQHLSAGLYLLQIEGNGEQIKIVKQ